MASKDRILRLKEETRVNILDAALQIAKEEGWQSLSMRKIAERIEYTAPIIYEYFQNKEAILLELTKAGFNLLSQKMKEAKEQFATPEAQMEAMWMAFWNFAFANKEYYQIMFGVEMNCCSMFNEAAEMKGPGDLVYEVLEEIMKPKNPSEEELCRRYYTFFSVVHGLISINIVRQGVSDEINHQILKDAIGGIINTIKA